MASDLEGPAQPGWARFSRLCLGTPPCRWEPGRPSYLATPALMGRMWPWTGVPPAGSPGGTGAQVPRAQAHGLRLFTLLLRAPLCSLSTQVTGQAWENCSVDAGSRRVLPTAPPPLGHLGWSWQLKVDWSQLTAPRKVWSTADWLIRLQCGEVRPEEGLGVPGAPACQAPPGQPRFCLCAGRPPASQQARPQRAPPHLHSTACTQRPGAVSPLLGGPGSPRCHLKNGDGQTVFLPQD